MSRILYKIHVPTGSIPKSRPKSKSIFPPPLHSHPLLPCCLAAAQVALRRSMPKAKWKSSVPTPFSICLSHSGTRTRSRTNIRGNQRWDCHRATAKHLCKSHVCGSMGLGPFSYSRPFVRILYRTLVQDPCLGSSTRSMSQEPIQDPCRNRSRSRSFRNLSPMSLPKPNPNPKSKSNQLANGRGTYCSKHNSWFLVWDSNRECEENVWTMQKHSSCNVWWNVPKRSWSKPIGNTRPLPSSGEHLQRRMKQNFIFLSGKLCPFTDTKAGKKGKWIQKKPKLSWRLQYWKEEWETRTNREQTCTTFFIRWHITLIVHI